MATIAKRVAELRKRNGWTATQLGKELERQGIAWDRFTVASLENGKRQNVTVTEWLALARVLNIAPVHLLVESEHPGSEPTEAASPYQVTPTETVTRAEARAWVRGMSALPGTDLRVFYSEVPAEEWGNVWMLGPKPAEMPTGMRRGYGGFGNPTFVEPEGD